MSTTPLARITVEIVGASFHALVSPEDGTVRAAGFATEDDPEAQSLIERLAKLEPTLAAGDVLDAGSLRDSREVETVQRITDALSAYATGEVAAIEALSVAQPETPFRGEVWRALRRVPAGAPVTYTELAGLAGRPSAVRAAASGCANNLVALIVPCHRIVRSDGGLGGYLFGTEIKSRLLAHEAENSYPGL